MKKTMVTREQIERYNAMHNATKGTNNYGVFSLFHQWKNPGGKTWSSRGSWGGIIQYVSGEYYIKKVRDTYYIYWESVSDMDRWELCSEVARAYFGIKEEGKEV